MRSPCAGRLSRLILLAVACHAAGFGPCAAAQTPTPAPGVDAALEARLRRLEERVAELSRQRPAPPPPPPPPGCARRVGAPARGVGGGARRPPAPAPPPPPPPRRS